MRKSKRKGIMAYIYMPLFFMITGYLLLALVFSPFLKLGWSVASLTMGSAVPEFEPQLTSIFVGAQAGEESGEADGETVSRALVQIPDYESHYAQIACEAIDLDVPLYFADSETALLYGVGQYIGSFLPGYGRTILVAGHNQTLFKPLQYIEVGDTVTITTNYGVYEYEVEEIAVHRHDDPEAVDIGQEERELLVLYTCYPFTAISGVKQERLFVYAAKISGPDVV